VVEEFKILASYDIKDRIFIVDSEFNTSVEHAFELCRAIIKENLDIRWTCYMDPTGITREFLSVMRRAGCEMIVWGIDSASEKMLESLMKGYDVQDIVRATSFCDELGMPYTLVLLFGAPGENIRTINETWNIVSKINYTNLGVMTGIRIYPGTPLYGIALRESEFSSKNELLRPRFYREDYTREVLFSEIQKKFSNLNGAAVVSSAKKTPFESKEFQHKLARCSVTESLRTYQV